MYDMVCGPISVNSIGSLFLLSFDDRLSSQDHRGEHESQGRQLLFSVVYGITGTSFLRQTVFQVTCSPSARGILKKQGNWPPCSLTLGLATWIALINKMELKGECARFNLMHTEDLPLSFCHPVPLLGPWKGLTLLEGKRHAEQSWPDQAR